MKSDSVKSLYDELYRVLTERPPYGSVSDTRCSFRITKKSDRLLLEGKLHELRKAGRFSDVQVKRFADIWTFTKL